MCAIEIEPTLRSARLRLRQPRQADADRIAAYSNDFDVARMTSRIPHPYDLEDAKAFLSRQAGKDPQREVTYAIEHVSEGFVGAVSLFPNDQERSEIGYWLGRPYWGRGYATEAVVCALTWAKSVWGRRHVVAGHFNDNPASGEVLIKSGFLYTGEVKPMVCVARGKDALARMMVWLA